MRICLGTLHANKHFLPLALMYLKASLVERAGWEASAVDIVEFRRADTPEAIAAAVLATQPTLVGFSCYVWNIVALRKACAHIKAARPDVTIVVGGPEVGPVGEAVLAANPAIDAVVKSEGEGPFVEIAQAMAAGGSLATVAGIWCRARGGLLDTGDATVLTDLNTLPSPHQDRYAVSGRRVATIETQRGCVFRCNFCFYNKDLSIRNRRFDMDRVKREIQYWLDRDAAEIFLMDPIFNLKADRAKEICRFIAAHNRRGVPFRAEVWAEFIDDELAQLMRDANIRFLEVGLQSADQAALSAVERRLRLAPFVAGVEHLRRHGIPFELQLILGLPGEALASFRRSIDFAAELDPPRLAAFPLMVLPGTELWRKASAIGLRYDPDPPYRVREHPDLTEGEVAQGLKLVDAIDDIGNARAVRLLGRDTGLGLAAVLDAWVDAGQERVEEGSTNARARAFVEAFCRRHDIPADFYTAFAEREFAD